MKYLKRLLLRLPVFPVLLTSLALPALLLSLCSCSNTSPRSRVEKAFPGGEITSLPDNTWKFIVRQPDGSVYYADASYSLTTNLLFRATKTINIER